MSMFRPTKPPTKGSKNRHNGRQGETRPREGRHTIQERETRREKSWETRREKASGRRTHHPTKDNKKRDKLGYKLEDKGEKALGRRTHYPTKGNKKGDNGRQGETRPSVRRAHHPRETTRGTMGDKGRPDPREGQHTIQQKKQEGVQWETGGDKTLGKADTPSNKGTQEGV